jgi:hypothetical protein
MLKSAPMPPGPIRPIVGTMKNWALACLACLAALLVLSPVLIHHDDVLLYGKKKPVAFPADRSIQIVPHDNDLSILVWHFCDILKTTVAHLKTTLTKPALTYSNYSMGLLKSTLTNDTLTHP